MAQPQSKRVRTSDAQRPRDPSEELSQVAGLVERRRMQNRISQRNYREIGMVKPRGPILTPQ